jgi:hypothetical protein
METIDTTVYCSHPSFRAEPATYKIAATWTGGGYSELKTYGFAHDACVAEVYAQAALRTAEARIPVKTVGDRSPMAVGKPLNNRKSVGTMRAKQFKVVIPDTSVSISEDQ